VPSTTDHKAAAGGAEGGRRNGSGAAEPHDEPRVRQLLRQWRVFPGQRQPQGSRTQSVLNNRALHPQPDRVNVITINVVPFPLPASRGSPHLNLVNLHALACLLPVATSNPTPLQLYNCYGTALLCLQLSAGNTAVRACITSGPNLFRMGTQHKG